MMRKLCEPITGRVAGVRVLLEADVVARGYPKREGILGYVDGTFSVCDKENKNKRTATSPCSASPTTPRRGRSPRSRRGRTRS